jgi:hypothetical protein
MMLTESCSTLHARKIALWHTDLLAADLGNYFLACGNYFRRIGGSDVCSLPVSRTPRAAFRLHLALLSLGSSAVDLLQLCIPDAIALDIGRKICLANTGSATACDELSRRWLDRSDSHLDFVARLDLAYLDHSACHIVSADRLSTIHTTEFGRWRPAV